MVYIDFVMDVVIRIFNMLFEVNTPIFGLSVGQLLIGFLLLEILIVFINVLFRNPMAVTSVKNIEGDVIKKWK